MNIILLDAEELSETKSVTLTGRRFEHIRQVLKAEVGDRLRVGQINGQRGHAEVLSIDAHGCQLACVFAEPPPPTPEMILIIALPRPQTLKKLLLEATSLGIAALHFVRGRRTDKNYFQSKVLEAERLRHHLLLGLEQSGDTRLPPVTLHKRFRPFVEDSLDSLLPDACQRLLADAQSHRPLAESGPIKPGPVALAIGPEGGWTDFEREQWRAAGFDEFSLGPRILRVETAALVAMAQLRLLQQLWPNS